MANTTVITVQATDGWVAVSEADPLALSVQCLDVGAVWHLWVSDGAAPAVAALGHLFEGRESWECGSITGTVYVRVDRASVKFAITE